VPTSYTYAPFGASTLSGAPTANSLEYTGRENDGTGLYYYRARYYHPGLQRFLSEDRLRRQGDNLYAYVSNDPIGRIDPLGLWGFGIIGGTNAEVGAPILGGLAATGSLGFGLFGGGSAGTDLGGFYSYGGAAVPSARVGPDADIVVGLFAGFGGGTFVTNATSSGDLTRITNAYALDLGLGLAKLSIQVGTGGGLYFGSATFGPGCCFGITKYSTTTVPDDFGGRPRSSSKSNR
jgi:RHS repeat-associated protein